MKRWGMFLCLFRKAALVLANAALMQLGRRDLRAAMAGEGASWDGLFTSLKNIKFTGTKHRSLAGCWGCVRGGPQKGRKEPSGAVGLCAVAVTATAVQDACQRQSCVPTRLDSTAGSPFPGQIQGVFKKCLSEPTELAAWERGPWASPRVVWKAPSHREARSSQAHRKCHAFTDTESSRLLGGTHSLQMSSPFNR